MTTYKLNSTTYSQFLKFLFVVVVGVVFGFMLVFWCFFFSFF